MGEAGGLSNQGKQLSTRVEKKLSAAYPDLPIITGGMGKSGTCRVCLLNGQMNYF